MATFKMCDMCGEPIVKGELVYRLSSSVEGRGRERDITVQQQQLCLKEEVHERCMRKLVGYYRAYQRGVR